MKGALGTSAMAVAMCSTLAIAQTSCRNVLAPAYKPPVVAAGWQAQIVASGMQKPRTLEFDSAGGLLVLDAGRGVFRLTFKDNGGTCLEVDQTTMVVNNTALNHGMALSADGRALYASTVQSVFRWAYDAGSGRVAGGSQEVVTNMRNNAQTTRTLLMSRRAGGQLIVTRGSSAELDPAALDIGSGLSQIRAFDTTSLGPDSGPMDFGSKGRRLGWGLRNSVAVAEHPTTGGIYSMDNTADGIVREGVDVSFWNPGDELNFHGYLNGSTEHQGGNYGYPTCFAVRNTTTIPNSGNLKVGDQFGANTDSSNSDEACVANYTAPRLTFPAHYAPMDIKFNQDGSTAYLSFRGSLNKSNPVGYLVAAVDFDKDRGEPIAERTSVTSLKPIISNDLVGQGHTCPDTCMRPVGMNWDSRGRLWVAADSTGEIYVLESQSGTPTGSGEGVMVTKPANGAATATPLLSWILAVFMAVAVNTML
ncbi:hypothetical protein RB595_006032 [Gaeumannomyces hyphopodioides]